jgi:hypothetical protein
MAPALLIHRISRLCLYIFHSRRLIMSSVLWYHVSHNLCRRFLEITAPAHICLPSNSATQVSHYLDCHITGQIAPSRKRGTNLEWLDSGSLEDENKRRRQEESMVDPQEVKCGLLQACSSPNAFLYAIQRGRGGQLHDTMLLRADVHNTHINSNLVVI